MPTTRRSSSVARAARRRSSRNTRRRHGRAASSAAGGGGRPDRGARVSRSQPAAGERGGLGGGVGWAPGLVVALFPFAAVGGGLLAGTTAGGAILGAVAGHAAAGMSRSDLKELGEHLDAGQAGLVVVAVADMGAKVEQAMQRATRIQQKQLEADVEALEQDAAAVGAKLY